MKQRDKKPINYFLFSMLNQGLFCYIKVFLKQRDKKTNKLFLFSMLNQGWDCGSPFPHGLLCSESPGEILFSKNF